MRSRLGLVLASLALLVVPAAAAAAPVSGPYHGVVNGTVTNPCGGNEGEGFFRLRPTGSIGALGNAAYCGGRVTVSHILVPSDFVCNQFNANLSVGAIPVDAAGAFVHTERAPIGPGGAPRKVTFSGSWVTDTRVAGSTRIQGGGCNHVARWRMNAL